MQEHQPPARMPGTPSEAAAPDGRHDADPWQQPSAPPPRSPAEGDAPAFNAPLVVVALIAVLALAHLLRTQWLDEAANLQLLSWLAVIPPMYAQWWAGVPMASLPGEGVGLLLSPFGHFFLHANWPHLVMNALWLLVFGTPVARRLEAMRFLLLALLSAAGGALVFVLLHWGEQAFLVGASGGISGLMGASVRLIYAHDLPLALGLRQDMRHVRPLTFMQALALPRPRMFILVWIGLNILISFTGMGLGGEAGRIAGEAHLGGFFTGMALFGLLDRRR